MCHHVHIRLSAEDKAAIKQAWGWLAPVCAVAVPALVAGVAVSSTPRDGKLVASSSAPAPGR